MEKEAMDNDIELFGRYVDGTLSAEEEAAFRHRLDTDKSFLTDFRIYLFTLAGIIREAEQDNLEFTQAMKRISRSELLRIVGRGGRRRAFRPAYMRVRAAWAASIAAVVMVGLFTVLGVHRADMHRLDNTIVAYNYIPENNRGWETITSGDIAQLERAYRNAPADDVQMQQEAGMRLAMAYLKLHRRSEAVATLHELETRFAADEHYAAQCRRIINQLK